MDKQRAEQILGELFTKRTTRECGSCSLCCKLLPVKEFSKPAVTRCKYQRRDEDGCCTIYKDRPISCRAWSCQWLMRAEAANLSRPDRSHVVLDMMPDVIHVTDEDKGYDFDMEVIQVWVDPAHKDAWRHPSLLDYFWHACERKKKEGRRLALLIRYSADEGFAVFPPATADGQWTIHQTDGDWTERPTGETMERLMNL